MSVYTLIKHGFLTNQSAHRVLSILLVVVFTKAAPALGYDFFFEVGLLFTVLVIFW